MFMVSKKDQKLKHTKKQQNPVTHRACGQAKTHKGGKTLSSIPGISLH